MSRKVSRSGGGRDTNVDKLRREISDFESSASAMIGKMRRANKRLNELDEESDLRLRQDLIDMESRYASCFTIPCGFRFIIRASCIDIVIDFHSVFAMPKKLTLKLCVMSMLLKISILNLNHSF